MRKILVYCGESIDLHSNRTQLHPLNEVKEVLEYINATYNFHICSNSPDFVMAMKHIGEKYKVDVEFFLNGVSQGNDIERIFEDFNKAFDLMNEILDNNEPNEN